MAETNCWQRAIVCETCSKKNGGFKGSINVSFGKIYDLEVYVQLQHFLKLKDVTELKLSENILPIEER